MIKTTKIFFLFLIAGTLSCSKEEVNIINGKVINGNKEYELNYVYLSITDSDLGIYQLHLSDDEINVGNGERYFSENPTIAIDITLYNNKNSDNSISNYYPLSDINPGHPEYDPPYLRSATTHFDLKKVGDNWETEESYYFWDDGSFTIIEDREGYRLDFTLVRGDRIIKGYFNGVIQIVE